MRLGWGCEVAIVAGCEFSGEEAGIAAAVAAFLSGKVMDDMERGNREFLTSALAVAVDRRVTGSEIFCSICLTCSAAGANGSVLGKSVMDG